MRTAPLKTFKRSMHWVSPKVELFSNLIELTYQVYVHGDLFDIENLILALFGQWSLMIKVTSVLTVSKSV